MHDIIVRVNDGVPGFVLWLFNDVAPLHVWRKDHGSKPEVLQALVNQGHAHAHPFAAGEVFRINWMTTEMKIVDEKTSAALRYDLVSLIQETTTAADPIIRVRKGWVSKELIDMSEHVDELITVKRVHEPESEKPIVSDVS